MPGYGFVGRMCLGGFGDRERLFNEKRALRISGPYCIVLDIGCVLGVQRFHC